MLLTIIITVPLVLSRGLNISVFSIIVLLVFYWCVWRMWWESSLDAVGVDAQVCSILGKSTMQFFHCYPSERTPCHFHPCFVYHAFVL